MYFVHVFVNGEWFFSLSAIHYVRGNRALGKAIPFVQVSVKCNKYQ